MDIFTTQLTKVVQAPIKPATLKVKALLKEAGTTKLKEDHEHLENHDCYFREKENDKEKNQENSAAAETELIEQQVEAADETHVESISETKEKVKHLDLYV